MGEKRDRDRAILPREVRALHFRPARNAAIQDYRRKATAGRDGVLCEKDRPQQETGRDAGDDSESELRPISGDVRKRAARRMGCVGE